MALIPCPECGHMVSPNAEQCPSCGAPIKLILAEKPQKAAAEPKTDDNTSVSNKEKKDVRTTIIIGVTCFLVVLILALVLFIPLTNKNKSAQNNEPTISDNSYDSPYSTEPYILDTQILNENDIRGKSKSDLRIMRNEIYARHGYVFKSSDLQNYFSQKPWYNGTIYNANDISFNSIEKKNIEFIKSHE